MQIELPRPPIKADSAAGARKAAAGKGETRLQKWEKLCLTI
jgi:hypothetical protein